jgi:hypothetical protein
MSIIGKILSDSPIVCCATIVITTAAIKIAVLEIMEDYSLPPIG